MIFQLVLMQIKHFICDYPLQTSYILGKFKDYPEYVKPLAAHCGVQAIGTLILCLLFSWPLWFVLLDFVSHFVIDRVKASPKLGGRYKPDNPRFWHCLGLDQLAHHLIGILMVYLGSRI
jgi:hypothetical protein